MGELKSKIDRFEMIDELLIGSFDFQEYIIYSYIKDSRIKLDHNILSDLVEKGRDAYLHLELSSPTQIGQSLCNLLRENPSTKITVEMIKEEWIENY